MSDFSKTILLLFSQPWQVGGAETHLETLVGEYVNQQVPVILVGIDSTIVARFPEIPVYSLPLRSANLAVQWGNYRKLKQLVTLLNVVIVHSHTRTGNIFGWLLQKSLGISYTATLHDKWRSLHRLYTPFLPNRCIAVSEGIKNHFVLHMGIEAERIEIIENGVSIERNKGSVQLNCRSQYPFLADGKNEQIIFHASRFSRHKRNVALRLCEVMTQLNADFPNSKLVLAGQGDLSSEVLSAAQEANKRCGRQVVFFLGPRHDVIQLLTLSTIAIGVGRFALEAMAAGKPVIALINEGDFPGIINEHTWRKASKTSWTIGDKPNTDENLRREIEILLQNQMLRDSLGGFGQELIKTHFSAARMADQVFQLYKSL